MSAPTFSTTNRCWCWRWNHNRLGADLNLYVIGLPSLEVIGGRGESDGGNILIVQEGQLAPRCETQPEMAAAAATGGSVHDIEELDVQKGHVVVHGVVGSTSDAKSIEASLKNEKCFSDVKVSHTNQVVGGERQKYVLEFDIKCPEDQKAKKKDKTQGASSASALTSISRG